MKERRTATGEKIAVTLSNYSFADLFYTKIRYKQLNKTKFFKRENIKHSLQTKNFKTSQISQYQHSCG